MASNRKRKPIKMKLLIKSLSILAIGGISPERLLPDQVMPTLDSLRPASRKPALRKTPNTSRSLSFDPEAHPAGAKAKSK
jgi:hypothetical protein